MLWCTRKLAAHSSQHSFIWYNSSYFLLLLLDKALNRSFLSMQSLIHFCPDMINAADGANQWSTSLTSCVTHQSMNLASRHIQGKKWTTHEHHNMWTLNCGRDIVWAVFSTWRTCLPATPDTCGHALSRSFHFSLPIDFFFPKLSDFT